MCGVIGMAGDLNVTHEKAMKTLLILDALRGVDSTGVVYISKQGDVKLAKQIGVPYELFDHKSFEKATAGLQKVMIGHNRAATSGAITRQNAHPFDLGPIVGVHNGVVRNKHVLADAGDFKVDSENLYHHILKHGIEDALSKIDAAYALVWWDKKEETINFLRNKDRPLFWASSVDAKGEVDGKCIFWASEAWMLNVALSRESIAHSKPEMLTVDMHFSLKVENGGKLGKAIAKKAEHTFRPAQSTYNNYHYSRYDEYWEREAQSQQSAPQTKPQGTETTVTPAATSPSTNNVIPLSGPKKVEEEEGKAFDRFYIKRKGVLFEVMEACTDQDNVVFLPCFDPKHPYKDIRLYLEDQNSPVWEFQGGEIQADVDGFCPTAGFQNGYYKLKVNSVRVLVAPTKIEEEVLEPAVWRDATGKVFTAEEFKRRHKDCSFCASPLVFGDNNKISTQGECFCPECAKRDEVLQMVKF